jgi:hypothetical protein
MVAFYAYFLLFSVNKTSEGEIRIVKKSHSIEIQTNLNGETIANDACYSFNSFFCETPHYVFEKSIEKQKWKHSRVVKKIPFNFPNSTLFGRPPPVLA